MKTPRRSSAPDTRPTDPLSLREAEEIGKAIVGVRKRAGMTQVEIAKAMGITQGTVATLESGRSLPRLSTLQRLARATSTQLNLSFDPVSNHDRIASHTMTDTLSRPRFSTDRRHFLGGAMGLAGMLGFGKATHITAQEATATAGNLESYVWTAPEWGEEPHQFEVLEHRDDVAIVRTMAGDVEVPSNPQRIVALSDEYISLFELGISDSIVGWGSWSLTEPFNAGELTSDLHAALADAQMLDQTELDVEKVILLEPDAILGNAWQTEDVENQLSQVAPYVPTAKYMGGVPRAMIRDYGDLFSIKDHAANYIAEHDAFILRARTAITPVIQGKKTLVGQIWEGQFSSVASHYLDDGKAVAHTMGYSYFRELGMTPTSFVESTAEQNHREDAFVSFSMEEFGLVDADYVFYFVRSQELYEEFMNHPAVQASAAHKNGSIFKWDQWAHGYGLAGVRADVAWIVETLTGEPFE